MLGLYNYTHTTDNEMVPGKTPIMTSSFPECMFNYEQYVVVLAMCLCPRHGFTL